MCGQYEPLLVLSNHENSFDLDSAEGVSLDVYDQQPMYASYKYIGLKCSCDLCERVNTVFSLVLSVVRAVHKLDLRRITIRANNKWRRVGRSRCSGRHITVERGPICLLPAFNSEIRDPTDAVKAIDFLVSRR
jgi:hypothetical protein